MTDPVEYKFYVKVDLKTLETSYSLIINNITHY